MLSGRALGVPGGCIEPGSGDNGADPPSPKHRAYQGAYRAGSQYEPHKYPFHCPSVALGRGGVLVSSSTGLQSVLLRQGFRGRSPEDIPQRAGAPSHCSLGGP
jgi:hypothetical protein